MYNRPADNNFEQAIRETKAQNLKIPVFEERLRVDKSNGETAKVTITKAVHSEQQTVNIPVVEENVNVERVPINQYIESAPPAVRYEGEKTIIPILKEVLVVEKKLVLVEEVHITRTQTHSAISQEETLRQEEVIVNRVDISPTTIK